MARRTGQNLYNIVRRSVKHMDLSRLTMTSVLASYSCLPSVRASVPSLQGAQSRQHYALALNSNVKSLARLPPHCYAPCRLSSDPFAQPEDRKNQKIGRRLSRFSKRSLTSRLRFHLFSGLRPHLSLKFIPKTETWRLYGSDTLPNLS